MFSLRTKQLSIIIRRNPIKTRSNVHPENQIVVDKNQTKSNANTKQCSPWEPNSSSTVASVSWSLISTYQKRGTIKHTIPKNRARHIEELFGNTVKTAKTKNSLPSKTSHVRYPGEMSRDTTNPDVTNRMWQTVATSGCNLPFTEGFAQQTEFKTEFECMEIHEMNKYLSKFHLSARKQDGSHYKETSSLSIRAAWDRYLRSPLLNKKFSGSSRILPTTPSGRPRSPFCLERTCRLDK